MKKLSAEAIKSMGEMGGTAYAMQEAWDIQNAAQVLSQIAYMCINECDEPDDMRSLANIMIQLMEFINGEIKEMVASARTGEAEKTVPAEVRTDHLNLSYVKSLGLVTLPELAVKFVAKDEIRGYSQIWGNPEKTDLEVEYFTRETNFWDGEYGKSRALTWDHAQDKDFKADPVIGTITDFGDDEIGRWYVAKLNRAHQYNKAIAELIKAGKLGTSSDSAPQYVERVKTGKATWLKTWPFFAAALTDTPCEPRMIGSLEFLKSLGITLPDTPSQEWQEYQAKRDFLTIKYLGDR